MKKILSNPSVYQWKNEKFVIIFQPLFKRGKFYFNLGICIDKYSCDLSFGFGYILIYFK